LAHHERGPPTESAQASQTLRRDLLSLGFPFAEPMPAIHVAHTYPLGWTVGPIGGDALRSDAGRRNRTAPGHATTRSPRARAVGQSRGHDRHAPKRTSSSFISRPTRASAKSPAPILSTPEQRPPKRPPPRTTCSASDAQGALECGVHAAAAAPTRRAHRGATRARGASPPVRRHPQVLHHQTHVVGTVTDIDDTKSSDR